MTQLRQQYLSYRLIATCGRSFFWLNLADYYHDKITKASYSFILVDFYTCRGRYLSPYITNTRTLLTPWETTHYDKHTKSAHAIAAARCAPDPAVLGASCRRVACIDSGNNRDTSLNIIIICSSAATCAHTAACCNHTRILWIHESFAEDTATSDWTVRQYCYMWDRKRLPRRVSWRVQAGGT